MSVIKAERVSLQPSLSGNPVPPNSLCFCTEPESSETNLPRQGKHVLSAWIRKENKEIFETIVQLHLLNNNSGHKNEFMETWHFLRNSLFGVVRSNCSNNSAKFQHPFLSNLWSSIAEISFFLPLQTNSGKHTLMTHTGPLTSGTFSQSLILMLE